MIDHLIDFFYCFLDRLGYLHPTHAPLTHFPIAGVVFALIFAILGSLFRNQNMTRVARYSLILAAVFAVPTIITGYMDWQYFYGGAWLFAIKAKLMLAGVLLVLLTAAVYVGGKGAGESGTLILLYVLCFVTVSALGYFGGDLVFAKRLTGVAKEYKAGETVFNARCAECHPHGGNVFDATRPLRGAPQFKEFDTFVSYLRNPLLPDGSTGLMPPLPPSKIPDKEAKELYDLITKVLLKVSR